MHTVTAEFDIIPGKEAAAEDAMKKIAAAVDANEPGCLVYTWHRSVKEPRHVLVYEVYRDDAAVAAHRASPYLAEFQKHFGPDGLFDPASVKIVRYDRIAAINR